MPKYCRAPHCSNAAGQARPPARRLSFYKFPLQDAARLRQWLAQMRQENWVPTRHQHLCSDHFEPSCFQYRWGVRYLRPDAVPTIFPRSPPKREDPAAPPGAAHPKQPLPASGAEPVTPGRSPDTVTLRPRAEAAGVEPPAAVPPPGYLEPAAAPEPVLSSALRLPVVSSVPVASEAVTGTSPPGELSTEELVGVVLVLQRKVKVLQQRQRRHRARLEAMEGLVEQLRRESLLSEERLKLACLEPGPVTPDPADAVTVICQEEAAAALVCAVSPPAGTTCGLGLQRP
ncbi:THAP domain-containing protein 8 [Mycteria americana]|uniref:THAP domain-containing protein 8 n=1 Tax=Mycteria americana TaxID=33587 RepID=UPI003F587F5A